MCIDCKYYQVKCTNPNGCDNKKELEQIRADERNNVLSTLKKLIDSDYNSTDCNLLFADLCESLVEELKEQK